MQRSQDDLFGVSLGQLLQAGKCRGIVTSMAMCQRVHDYPSTDRRAWGGNPENKAEIGRAHV